MSILNRKEEERKRPTKEKMIAQKLKKQVLETYKDLLESYINSLKTFWKNPVATPKQICAEFGTDAAEIFYLHARLGDFLYQFNPNRITQAKKLVGAFIVNEDGTVTIISEPAEEIITPDTETSEPAEPAEEIVTPATEPAEPAEEIVTPDTETPEPGNQLPSP